MTSVYPLTLYLALNIVLALAYLILRATLALPLMKKDILQRQRLSISRWVLCTSLLAFSLVQIFSWTPWQKHIHFAIHTVVQTLPMAGLDKAVVPNPAESQPILASENRFDYASLSLILLAIGASLFMLRYLLNIRKIHRIIKNSAVFRKVGAIRICFSQETEIPFCYSKWFKSYIVIPEALILKPKQFKISLAHELQHIRHRDTVWTHIFKLYQALCFINPAIHHWSSWQADLREYACDEGVILRDKISDLHYGQCLYQMAKDTKVQQKVPSSAVGLFKLFCGKNKQLLKSRIEKLFFYRNISKNKLFMCGLFLLIIIGSVTVAYVVKNQRSVAPLNQAQIQEIIAQKANFIGMDVIATPEVVSQINDIRESIEAKEYFMNALIRLKKYQPMLLNELQKRNMPQAVLAIPMVQSAFDPNIKGADPNKIDGIWHLLPETARNLGLRVTQNEDQRLNSKISTQAALNYLEKLYAEFGNWNLAFAAYIIGEKQLESLIQQTGSRDIWTIARSPQAPKFLLNHMALIDAAIIILANPKILQ